MAKRKYPVGWKRQQAEEEKKKKQKRDRLGRFAKMVESRSLLSRHIKLVRIRDSYNSYDVKEKVFTGDKRQNVYIVVGSLVIIAWLNIRLIMLQ